MSMVIWLYDKPKQRCFVSIVSSRCADLGVTMMANGSIVPLGHIVWYFNKSAVSKNMPG
jgi:hypothetical protein